MTMWEEMERSVCFILFQKLQGFGWGTSPSTSEVEPPRSRENGSGRLPFQILTKNLLKIVKTRFHFTSLAPNPHKITKNYLNGPTRQWVPFCLTHVNIHIFSYNFFHRILINTHSSFIPNMYRFTENSRFIHNSQTIQLIHTKYISEPCAKTCQAKQNGTSTFCFVSKAVCVSIND